MTIDVSEGIDPSLWAPLPTNDRVLVGGRTVWTGPFSEPVVVAQPNRWGVIEAEFPDVRCLLEGDPPVTGHLPQPRKVMGYVDRSHQPIDPPQATAAGERLMATAESLAKSITQLGGVTVAATPFARTIPLMIPLEPSRLIATCREHGLLGIHPLPGMAGGIALAVTERHGPKELRTIVEVLASAVAPER